ncbi:MAG: hypothetical protein LQ350_007054 [Teloschistes chrysophthalmus]|nr:MAG: hypothetical protein LQ350_007054 [Niorma chrysophthalma]
MPTGSKKPSIFTDFRKRMRLEWHRIQKRIEEKKMTYGYKFSLTEKRPRPKMGLRRIGPIAQALYRQMYNAYADGDVATLSTICTEGLLSSFKARIAARPHNERIRWTLHRFTRGPKFVSQRIAVLPLSGSAVRQVIVRLQSRQTLARVGSSGPGLMEDAYKQPDKEKAVSEYLVLQRRMWKGEEEPWMIWGTTEETTSIDTVLEPHTTPTIGQRPVLNRAQSIKAK